MIILGDCLERLREMPSEHFQTCITSPPYWGLRDYGVDGQLGLEKTPEKYVAKISEVFREVIRVLRNDGTLWLNLGDSYSGGGNGDNITGRGKNASQLSHALAGELKPKQLVGIPWRVAFALQSDGWYLRQDIIWHKPNPMPESVRDRCTKAHEYIFLLSRSPKYFFDTEAILEPFKETRAGKTGARGATPLTAIRADRNNSGGFTRSRTGRNKRSVWTVTTKAFKGAHFATFPPDLIEPCVLAGSSFGDYVLDPFAGAGTVGLVCKKHGRKFVGIELNEKYKAMAEKRINDAVFQFNLGEIA